MIDAILNGQNVTIVGIIPNGNNVMVSYIDASSVLKVTLFDFNPRSTSAATIATSASVI
jgi:hypothetical protein